MYQAGVDTAQGLVNGLNAQSSALAAAAKSLAAKLTAEVKKELGIHSPSTVAHGIGVNYGQGMVNGIAAMRPAVASEMRALADTSALSSLTTPAAVAPVRTREIAGTGGRATGGSVAVAPPTVHVYLDGQEWRGIARVEAEGIVVDALTGAVQRGAYNG
jgi:hypothetical protein